jgi:hypothetical protein
MSPRAGGVRQLRISTRLISFSCLSIGTFQKHRGPARDPDIAIFIAALGTLRGSNGRMDDEIVKINFRDDPPVACYASVESSVGFFDVSSRSS